MKAISYQLCPKCQGDGHVWTNEMNGSLTGIISGDSIICDLCNGAKIIPMCSIEGTLEDKMQIVSFLNPDVLIEDNKYVFHCRLGSKGCLQGFGDTVAEAMENFVDNFYNQKLSEKLHVG